MANPTLASVEEGLMIVGLAALVIGVMFPFWGTVLMLIAWALGLGIGWIIWALVIPGAVFIGAICSLMLIELSRKFLRLVVHTRSEYD